MAPDSSASSAGDCPGIAVGSSSLHVSPSSADQERYSHRLPLARATASSRPSPSRSRSVSLGRRGDDGFADMNACSRQERPPSSERTMASTRCRSSVLSAGMP